MQSDDLRATVHRHDRDISSIRSDVEHMSKAIDGVKTDTSRIFEKLDLALMTSRAQGQITLRVVSDALQVCVYGTVLIAAVVSGIVYIATNATSQETAVLSYKVERLVGSFGWRPEVRRAADPPHRP